MRRINFLALIVAAVVAFIASSLWYSPALFGHQFAELSGIAANAKPNAGKAVFELIRTFILAFIVARLVLRLNITDWKGGIGLGIWLWFGFPVILLTGSILWQNVPWQLAAIHAGDWLIKLILIPAIVAVWPSRKAASTAS